jgi:hypothetical protein
MGDTGSVVTVTVTNGTGSVSSIAATLTVKAIPPTVTVRPSSEAVLPGQTATFDVVAGGTGPLSYQWYKNGIVFHWSRAE